MPFLDETGLASYDSKIKAVIAATDDNVAELKDDVTYGNINQHIKVNPFVIGTGTTIGEIRANRASITVNQDGSIIVARNSTSSTQSYGFFIYIENATNNLGHKIYLNMSGIDVSGATHFSALGWFGSNDGTSAGGISEDFSNVSSGTVEKIVTLTGNINQLNVVLRPGSAPVNGEYFTLSSMQYIDLTAMFGAGYEPSLEQFKAIYTDVPYDFRMPDISSNLLEVKTLLYPLTTKNYVVVENQSELLDTTANYVLVMRNDHAYGDNGQCWFYTRLGETDSDGGVVRNDGSVVFPVPDQGQLTTGKAPYHKLLNVIKSYVDKSSLVYGNAETLYDSTCSNQIDCSSFITAVLNGVTYNNSRYVLGSNSTNKIGEHVGQTLFIASSTPSQWTRLNTRKMASWFAQNKQLHTIRSSGQKICNILQFGDILFARDTQHESSYFGIGHVLFVLGTIPENSRVIVAQAGGTVASTVDINNESTVVKTSSIVLTNQNILDYYPVFARPVYSQDDCFNYGANHIFDSSNVLFTLNSIVDGTSGRVTTTSEFFAATHDYYKVPKGATLTYTGTATDNGVGYLCNVAQYDENKEFISRDDVIGVSQLVLNSNTTYIRFMFGHSLAQDSHITLNKLHDFQVTLL